MGVAEALSRESVLRRLIPRNFLGASLVRGVKKWGTLGAASPIFGVLECPEQDRAVSDRFEVRGWVVSEDGEVPRGEIIVAGRSFPLVLNESRVDVARAFGLEAQDSVVGFRRYFDWSSLPEDTSRAELRVVFNTSRHSVSFGPVRIEKALHLPLQRYAVSLEKPGTQEIVSRDIEIRGWLLSLVGQPVSARAIINDTHVFPLEFSEPRPDVLCAYDRIGEDARVGFQALVGWRDLMGEDDSSELDEARVLVELVHGGELIIFGPYTVTRTTAPVLRHQRGSYKDVWNGAAHNEASAIACVSGHDNFSEFFDSGSSTAQTLTEALKITTEDVVLEIGCGVGRVGKFLFPRCRYWIGADISSRMLSYAAQNLAEAKNVQLLELSGCCLDKVDSESIDKIYCSTVFMHLDEWDRWSYVAEAFRVLKPGGRCYFDNVNLSGAGGWEVFSGIAKIDAAQRSAAVSKTSTGEELEAYLRMAGFRVLEIRREELYVSAIGEKVDHC